MCLDKYSKEVTVNNMEKTKIKGFVYIFFFVTIETNDISDIVNIHKHMMKNHEIV